MTEQLSQLFPSSTVMNTWSGYLIEFPVKRALWNVVQAHLCRNICAGTSLNKKNLFQSLMLLRERLHFLQDLLREDWVSLVGGLTSWRSLCSRCWLWNRKSSVVSAVHQLMNFLLVADAENLTVGRFHGPNPEKKNHRCLHESVFCHQQAAQLTLLIMRFWCFSAQWHVRSALWEFTSLLMSAFPVSLPNRAGSLRHHALLHPHLHGLGVHAALHRGVCLHLQESFFQQEERHHLGERSRTSEWGFPLTELHDGRFYTPSLWVNLSFGWQFKTFSVFNFFISSSRLSVRCPVWECGSQEPQCSQTWPRPRECDVQDVQSLKPPKKS